MYKVGMEKRGITTSQICTYKTETPGYGMEEMQGSPRWRSYLIALLSLDELCRQKSADGLLHELIHALK